MCDFCVSDLQSPKNLDIDVGDVTVGTTLLDAETNSAGRSAAETSIRLETKKPASRPKKTDGEICLNSKWVTDVDRVQVSEEKRRQMMKKARAISRAISNKAAQMKHHLPATSTEQSQSANDHSAAEKKTKNEFIQSAAKTNIEQHDSGKSRWRIPRVQNVQVMTDSVAAVGNQPTLVSKVSPPLSKDVSSSYGWHRPSHTTGRFRKIGAKASHRPFTGYQTADSKAETSTVRLSTSSQMLTIPSSQTLPADMTEVKLDDRITAHSDADVSVQLPANTKTSDDSFSGRDSSQNLLRIPSREMIEKIESSSKQKSTIFLPYAVPARGERGTAVGINVPSQKNLSSNLSTARTNMSPTAMSICHTSSVIVNTSAPPSSISPSQSAATKKRKLNISQYKSILPQRQKTLMQSPAVAQPVDLPAVYVYGRCKDILRDHDYVSERKPSTECSKEPSVENMVLPESSETVAVKDNVSKAMEAMQASTGTLQDETERPITVSVNGIMADYASQSKRPTSASSAILDLKQGPGFVCKGVNNSSAPDMQDVTIDCMPAYFDVVSLPNRQTKISVSTATLLTKKRHNPQSVIIADDNDLTQRLSENGSDDTLHCEKDVGCGIESHVSVSDAFLLNNKRHNPQSAIIADDSNLTQRLSEVCSDDTLHCEKDVGHGIESHVSVSDGSLLNNKMHNPQSAIIADDSNLIQQLSEFSSDDTLHCEKDVGRCIESHVSVLDASLLTKKRHNPQPVIIDDDSELTEQLSENGSDNILHCEKDVSYGIESHMSVSPRRRLDSVVATVENRCASRSGSVSSAISVSSDDESSRSRSSSRHRSSRDSSYSSDSWSENFIINLLNFFTIFVVIV